MVRRRRGIFLGPALRILAFRSEGSARQSLSESGTAHKLQNSFRRSLQNTNDSFTHRKTFHDPFWTLADQGVISLGAFLLNLLLARQLSESDYGIFALLIGGYFFVQHTNASLFYYPMMLRLAGGNEERTSDLIFTSVAFTTASSLAFSTIVFAFLSAFGRPDVGAGAALYLVLWQLQDVLRRSLLAEFRHKAATLGDGITYLGAAGAIAVLAIYHNLSLMTALLAMAGTCALAIVVQIVQRLPFVLCLKEPQELLRTFWMHGKWAFVNGIILIVTIQMFPWVLAITDGKAAVAEFQAALNIANVANPVAFGLCSLILPAAARAYEQDGVLESWRVAKTYILIGSALLSLYTAFVMITPETALSFFYGADSPYAKLHLAVSLLAFAVTINLIVEMINAFLYGVKAAKLAVWMNGISLGVAVLLLPLLGPVSIVSCALVLAAAKVIRLMVAWRLVTLKLSPSVRFWLGHFAWAGEGRRR